MRVVQNVLSGLKQFAIETLHTLKTDYLCIDGGSVSTSNGCYFYRCHKFSYVVLLYSRG